MVASALLAGQIAGRYLLPLLLAWAVWMLAGCEQTEQRPTIDLSKRIDESQIRYQVDLNSHQPATLLFGFDLRDSPQEDARQYLPFLDYLSRTTGYTFKLHFTAPSSTTAEELGTGVVQFAAIGASAYLQAHELYQVVPLVRGLNIQGQAAYQSVLVTRPDSKIERVTDLRGKRMAFGRPNSTQGHLIPRIILKEYGLELRDLAAYEYTSSHRECVDLVISGRYDVCGMQDVMGRTLATQGLVKIIHTSDDFPSSGIAANAAVPPELLDQVSTALLDFDPLERDAAGLYHWDKTEMPRGFVRAAEQDYDTLRHWSIEFGILSPKNREAPAP